LAHLLGVCDISGLTKCKMASSLYRIARGSLLQLWCWNKK
jgi:hypothetical protein